MTKPTGERRVNLFEQAREVRIQENSYLADIELGTIAPNTTFKEWCISKGIDYHKLTNTPITSVKRKK